MSDDNLQNDGQDFDGQEGGQGSQGNQGNSQQNDFAIPDEYKDKGWTRFFEGKTGDELKKELFRSYDSSQVLIGKKVEDYLKTTDLKSLDNYEEIKNELQKQIGNTVEVPNDAKEYELENLLNDEKGERILSIEDDALKFFSDKFKEIGMSKQQAQQLFSSYVKYGIDEFHRFTDADELEKSIKTMFNEGAGNDKSAQRKSVEGLLKEFLPAEDQKIIQESVPNKVIEMFYKVGKGLVDKYGYKEGSTSSQGGGNFRMSEADRDAEYDRLYKRLVELDNSPHQRVGERDEIVKKMQELFK